MAPATRCIVARCGLLFPAVEAVRDATRKVLDTHTHADITKSVCPACIARMQCVICGAEEGEPFYFNAEVDGFFCAACQICIKCKTNNAVEHDPFVTVRDPSVSRENIAMRLCRPCITACVRCMDLESGHCLCALCDAKKISSEPDSTQTS